MCIWVYNLPRIFFPFYVIREEERSEVFSPLTEYFLGVSCGELIIVLV